MGLLINTRVRGFSAVSTDTVAFERKEKKKRGAELCAANKGLDLSLFLCIKGLRAQAWATNETVRTPR